MSRPDTQTLFLTLVAASLLTLTAIDAKPANAAAVNCYDTSREMVMRTRSEECRGKVVSDAEATAIRDRRQSYVRESLESNQNPIILGKRLVSVGAGFFVSPDGSMLTNAHVVKDCETLVVSRADGEMLPARLTVADQRIDLALLGTDFKPAVTAVFAPADAPLPEQVSIIGYPNQGLPPLRPLLTHGTIAPSKVVSAIPQPISIQADVRPGNSGGPALDEMGSVIGVVFAAVDTPAIFKNTGRVVRDIGIAIPNSLSLGFLERHGITPVLAKQSTSKHPTQPDQANQFVARIECWR